MSSMYTLLGLQEVDRRLEETWRMKPKMAAAEADEEFFIIIPDELPRKRPAPPDSALKRHSQLKAGKSGGKPQVHLAARAAAGGGRR